MEEEHVINLVSESNEEKESEDEETLPEKYGSKEDVGPKEEEEDMSGHDKAKEKKPPKKTENSKKREMEEDLDEEDHEVKRRKEFESWEDLEDLIRARMPMGNCRRRNEGPSNLFTNV